MRISDWSSDVCSSDLRCWALPSGQGTYAPGARSDAPHGQDRTVGPHRTTRHRETGPETPTMHRSAYPVAPEINHIHGNEPTVSTPPPEAANANANRLPAWGRSEEHTSELQSLMRISYAVFCLKKKKKQKEVTEPPNHDIN